LRFFDDGAAPQCRAGTTLAFTQTGSRLIRVCGPQFRDRFQQNRTTAEIVVIHEFLHSLGLGENPPTSEAITERVAARCGGRDWINRRRHPHHQSANSHRLRAPATTFENFYPASREIKQERRST
jgi:hypothetical protein